jgi:hypothetical protein
MEKKPQRHDRPERAPDARGTHRLQRKQRQQDQHRQRQHVMLQRWRDDVQPFQRR